MTDELILNIKVPSFSRFPSRGHVGLFLATRQFAKSTRTPQQLSADEDLPSKQQPAKQKVKTAERDLFLSVLSATATKREARSYLSRFTPPADGEKSSPQNQENALDRPLRIALIKIRALQELDEVILEGLAQTISQLARLGSSCVVVIDTALDSGTITSPTWREDAVFQADRLVGALQKETSIRARRLDYALGVTPNNGQNASRVSIRGDVEVQYPGVLFGSLRKGAIPIIPPIGYMTETQKMIRVEPDDVMLALTRLFAGLRPEARQSLSDGSNSLSSSSDSNYPKHFSVDRIILLDPLGGIPSATRPDKSHVFINLEQEYGDIRGELLSANTAGQPTTAANHGQSDNNVGFSILGASNPFSKVLEGEHPLTISEQTQGAPLNQFSTLVTNRNVMNLDLLQKTLTLLPTSSSALLTTPYEAATQSISQAHASVDLGVITRRPRNPLIYNLLTDKPLVSSSLPISRLGPSADRSVANGTQLVPATFLKRGMPLTMIPDPRLHTWEAPDMSKPQLSLNDPRIDLPRLLNLIEDSFGRPLDVEHYLDRIRNKIAGVIVAGEYEGGAILTWELPLGVPDDGSEGSRLRMVPYLDKFAVLKRSQGAGGVADIVFSAMVRSCFPHGVCWRSRKDNPVNKWYFERSVGTWKIPKSNWTMFWTTEGMVEDEQVFLDYANVCQGVLPSWADNKVAD